MAKFRIVHDRAACIGCGACASVCDNWEMAEDGKSKPKKILLEDKGCNEEAANVCPVGCIKIEKA